MYFTKKLEDPIEKEFPDQLTVRKTPLFLLPSVSAC